jgi:enamine deaminase RidA (YjgF/YER057c/UK114 family)
MMSISARLQQMGISLPPVAAPVGSYVPAIEFNAIVVTSGQLPMVDGDLSATGKVPSAVSEQQAAAAARVAAINGLAAIAAVAGDLERVDRILRVAVYVNSAAGFTRQPQVANGASDLLVDLFGDRGRHARLAVGVNELPLDSPVEVELTALLRKP